MSDALSAAGKRGVLAHLQYLVGFYKEQVQEAETNLHTAQRNLDEKRERLTYAKSLFEDQKALLGKTADSGPYAGLSLREAARRVIREENGQQIAGHIVVQRLKTRGYVLESEFPGRSLHAALIGVADVEKVGSGVYRWRSGTDHMNTLSSSKVEPVRSDGK